MASFTLDGLATFKENNLLRITNDEEARYGLAFDALYGDKDGLVEQEDISLYLQENPHTNLIDTSHEKPSIIWKNLNQEIESKLNTSWFKENAPWALEAFKPYLEIPLSQRSETIQKTLIRWISTQNRADQHNIAVVPKWVDNGMGGHLLALEYQPQDESTPLKAKQLMLPGSLTDPFFYDDMAFKQVANGYSFIVIDGPNGAYNIYGDDATGTKKGWGSIEGGDKLQVLSEIVDNTIVAFDLDKTDLPFVSLGYSYGAEIWQSWIKKSSSHQILSHYEGHIDIAGGWDTEETYKLVGLSLYLDYAKSLGFSSNPIVTRKLLSLFDMDNMMDLLYGAASPVQNEDWKNKVIAKIISANLFISNEMQYTESMMGDVTDRGLQNYHNHFSTLQGGCYDGVIGVLSTLKIIDQSFDPELIIDLYRYVAKDENNPDILECLANLDQAIKDRPRFRSTMIEAKLGEIGHIHYPFDQLATDQIDQIITQRLGQRKTDGSQKTSPLVQGNLLIKELNSFNDKEFKKTVKPAVESLASLSNDEIKTATNRVIGATAINHQPDRYILKLAYLLIKYKPLELNQKENKKIISLAINILNRQLAEENQNTASIENYLLALLKVHGQYISGENQPEQFADQGQVSALEINELKEGFFELLASNNLLHSDVAKKAETTYQNADFIAHLHQAKKYLNGFGIDFGYAYPWGAYGTIHYSVLRSLDQSGYNVFLGVTNLKDPEIIAGLGAFWFYGFGRFNDGEIKSLGAFGRFPISDLFGFHTDQIPVLPDGNLTINLGFEYLINPDSYRDDVGFEFVGGVGYGISF